MADDYDNKRESMDADPSDKTDPFIEPSTKGRKGGSRKRARRQGRRQSTRQKDSQAQSGTAASGASAASAASGASGASAASATAAPATSAAQISAPDLSGFDVFCDDYRYSNDDYTWDFYDDRPSAAGQAGQAPFAASDATRPLQHASSTDKTAAMSTAAMSTAAMQTAALPKTAPSPAATPYAGAPYAAASSTAQMPSVPSQGRQGQQVSPTEPFPTITPAATIKAAPANDEDESSSHRFGHALRWVFRILMLGALAFCLAVAWHLATLTDEESSSLSLVIALLDTYGVQVLESLDVPAFTESPVEWTFCAILYAAAKLAEYGLSVEEQLHVVVFALLGVVVTANVLAWFSGTRHRHTVLMTFASLLLCACASIASQYCAVYVLGYEFDLVAIVLEAVTCTCTVLVVVTVWRIVSAIYRSTFD